MKIEGERSLLLKPKRLRKGEKMPRKPQAQSPWYQICIPVPRYPKPDPIVQQLIKLDDGINDIKKATKKEVE